MKYSNEELEAALDRGWNELVTSLEEVSKLPQNQWEAAGIEAIKRFEHEDGTVPPRYKQIVRHYFTGEDWIDGRGWVLAS